MSERSRGFEKPVSGALMVAGALSVVLLGFPSPLIASAEPQGDLEAARKLFEANLQSIRDRDREAYLACYLQSDHLAVASPDGFSLGFQEFAAAAAEGWPDHFDAQDLRLVSILPGVVYGTYRYRVRYGDDEVTGLSERLFLKRPEGWRIALTTAFPAPRGTPPPPQALVGATLLDGTGAPPLADAVVLLRQGEIDCAGTRQECPIPEGVEVANLSGHWITPGLVDAHVHFSQTGWADGRPDALDVRQLYPYEQVQAELRERPGRFLRAYLCSGVTSVFDVGGYPWTWELGRRSASWTRGPRVAAAGPLLSTWDFWLNLAGERQFVYLENEEAAGAGVRYLASHGADAVKVWFIPTADRDFEEMASAVLAAGAEAQGLGVPLIVHATGLKEAKIALRAGAHLLVHSVWDQPVDQEFIDLALAAGTIYNPTLTVASGYERMFRSVISALPPTVDDPNGCVDRETLRRVAQTAELGAERVDPLAYRNRITRNARRQQTASQNLQRIHAAGILVAMGTDAGNPLTLHGPSVYAEMEAMQTAGLTPMEVLVSATRESARAAGLEDELGTVAEGKVADLLILDADPSRDISNLRRLRFVVRRGELRSLAELQAPSADEEQE